MVAEGKFVVPEDLKSLVEEHRSKLDISLREVAKRAKLSSSFVWRILAGERGLPDDDDLLRLAEALEIQPPERLLVEAGRIPENRSRMVPLMRAASELTEGELEKVLKIARQLARDRRNKKRKRK